MKKRYALILVIISCITDAHAQGVLPNTYVTNGIVRAIVQDGNTVYIGGDFTYVGPNKPYWAALDAVTGMPDIGYVKPNGIVNVAIPDGNGGWYIGGAFTRINGLTRNNIAEINADGSLNAWARQTFAYSLRVIFFQLLSQMGVGRKIPALAA
jgi:hypothetical protein